MSEEAANVCAVKNICAHSMSDAFVKTRAVKDLRARDGHENFLRVVGVR